MGGWDSWNWLAVSLCVAPPAWASSEQGRLRVTGFFHAAPRGKGSWDQASHHPAPNVRQQHSHCALWARKHSWLPRFQGKGLPKGRAPGRVVHCETLALQGTQLPGRLVSWGPGRPPSREPLPGAGPTCPTSRQSLPTHGAGGVFPPLAHRPLPAARPSARPAAPPPGAPGRNSREEPASPQSIVCSCLGGKQH